jgi:DHA1 family bicyclomycin/chloramphenicol resistance-like MFS transporter
VGLGPLVAPILGAQVLKFASWRGIFVVLGLFGIVHCAATAVLLPETHAQEHRLRGGMSSTWRTTRSLLSERSLVGLIFVSTFAGGAMVGYVGGSPFVLQEIYGASPQQYAAIFGINAIFMVGGAQLNAHLLGRRSARQLLGVGVLALVGAGSLLLAAAGLGQESLWIITPPLTLLAFSWSFIQANALGLALHDHPLEAGVTASLFGVAMYGLGALIAPLVTSGAEDMALSMAVVIACCAFGAGVSLRKYVPLKSPMVQLEPRGLD